MLTFHHFLWSASIQVKLLQKQELGYIEAPVRHLLCKYLQWITPRGTNIHNSITTMFLLAFPSILTKKTYLNTI